MHFNTLSFSLLASVAVTLSHGSAIPADKTTTASSTGATPVPKDLENLLGEYKLNTLSSLKGNCTKENIAVRKAWRSLCDTERMEYISAVKCLHKKPSKADPKVVPGARNRMDDFTYSHINQTNFIHNSGLLLPWHRVFIWEYEQALRNECGYTGYQPYWDWSAFSSDQAKSPLLDGSPTSMGGNGAEIKNATAVVGEMVGLPAPFKFPPRPAGNGGGCVAKGPFADFTVNLGPVSPNPSPNPKDPYGLNHNPRCLKRDFLESDSEGALSYGNVTNLLKAADIASFRPTLLERNMHPAAHGFLGGDAFDLYSSPSDPLFYLLHGQVDRLWTVWQGLDIEARKDQLEGTVTFLNIPPSKNATLDDLLILQYAGGNEKTIRSAMSATEGPYCYMYE